MCIKQGPNKNYTYVGTCWKCSEFGHLAKECKNITSNANQFDNNTQGQTMINSFRNLQHGSQTPQPSRQVIYPTHNFTNQATNINPTNNSRFSIISISLEFRWSNE